MATSLFTGVTGLQANQQMLDVVGNNLANSNTVGFKNQRVQFGDLVYQTLNPGTAATATSGGTDPIQTGLGVHVGAVGTDLAQGTFQNTGNELNVALQGNGFFVVNDGSQNNYTRAGAFGVNSQNMLFDPATGDLVQRVGTVGEGSATTPAFQTPGNMAIQIPYNTVIPGKATTSITLQGNLSAGAVGPLAEAMTSAAPFTSGAAPATAATLLNSLSDINTPYVATDKVHISGTTVNNTAVGFDLTVGPATTMGDILTAINTNFPGSTATLDANGNLLLTANNTGPASPALSISDVAGDTGSMSWNNHGMSVTTTGQNGTTVNSGIQFYDTQGNAHNLSLTFQKQSANVWSLTGSIPASDGTMVTSVINNITFNANGSFQGAGGGAGSMTVQLNGLAAPQTINFNFGTINGFNGLTQSGGTSSAAATNQDGYAAGSLSNVSISQDGTISGIFTNGQTLALAQLAVASFANPAALDREGSNYFAVSGQSGPALIGTALSGGRGSVQQKVLESSNVDVSQEFTSLIIAQRGFEVNAKTITVSDQVLQALVNIIQ